LIEQNGRRSGTVATESIPGNVANGFVERRWLVTLHEVKPVGA
jgi:hypothetical protein